jgi:hypothetical protein
MSTGPTRQCAAPPQRGLIQLAAPGTGGVRDYLECLRTEWAAVGLASHVVTLSESDASQRSLAERLREIVDAEGRPCAVILHFSGYGFHPRGLCLWLVREVEAARQQLGDRLHLVTMFHELYASGPPWGSAFWLSPVQAWIARRLARLSDVLWTNTELHGRWLRKQVGASVAIEVQPVFCTVGEPGETPPARGRVPRLIVFGSPSTRRRALERLPRYAANLQRQGLTEVIEVGSGAATPWPACALSVRFAGRLDIAELRELLETSAWGLIDYPPKYLGKSTVFAAYAVHGCVSLNTADAGFDSDGLQDGRHFLTLAPDAPIATTVEARQSIADAARGWYAQHSATRQAAAFAASCRALPTRKESP